MAERNLTIGTSESFEDFLNDEVVYVDKTGPISQLGKRRGSFLLTRPRSMGKTTMITTLEHLFSKGTEGIKGLDCLNTWSEPNRYFVFNFAFNEANEASGKTVVDSFKEAILADLEAYADYFGITLNTSWPLAKTFKALILKSLAKLSEPAFLASHPDLTEGDRPLSKNKVVLLIDEYDAPLTENLNNPIEFENLRKEYKLLFTAIKNLRCFRFVFITGVSSYSQTSIFSGANQFVNISLEDEYATCCGYTKEEIERYFAPELQNAQKVLGYDQDELLKELSYHYNGYLFSKLENSSKRIYSPVSVSLFLSQPSNGFDTYWSDTGANTTFALQLLKLCNPLVTEEILKRLYPNIFDRGEEFNPEMFAFIESWIPIISLSVNNQDQPILLRELS